APGLGLASGLVILVVLFAVMSSCRDPSDWYPCGTVELAGHYELESLGTKSLYATVRISNTGGSVISRSTIGLRATTDSGCYYATVVREMRILPGTAIWTTLTIPYASPAELLIEGGLVVQQGFFE
ncbi:MAG: hypothetical protein RBT68_11850, partial [Spirochaetia bacterium]|nr:hypothetical protein [Spirochaetia bacterium]